MIATFFRLSRSSALRRLAVGILAVSCAVASPVRAGTFPVEFPTASPETHGLVSEKLDAIWSGLEQRHTKIFVVMRNDRIVYERYAGGYTRTKPHYTASLAKALVGGLSLMLAIDDGRIDPADPASRYIPQWRDDPAKREITLAQLATHTSGIEDANEDGVPHRLLPGWKGDFWKGLPVPNDPFTLSRDRAPVLFTPGSQYHYSNPGIAMLTYCVTAALRDTPHRNVRSLLKHRVMDPLEIPETEWSVGYDTTYDVDGLPLVGSWGGAAFSANATARLGRLLLHKGDWDETTVFSQDIVARARRSAGLPSNSGLGWWINIRPDFTRVFPTAPADSFWGLGAGGQFFLVIPSLNLVAIRYGERMESDRELIDSVRDHVVAPLMQAFAPQSHPPYPPSQVIRRIEWAPADTIVRQAPGSDNWPMTWADDDALYTAYGDGNGFAPLVPDKLSLGFAKIDGSPGNLRAENIRTATGEQLGDGRHGKKASGILMVDGVLYLWVRNAANSQLAWSADHGKTWTWSEWKFTESFGAPSFLNFGRNYAGARDDYVYVYSTDADTAYVRADRLVLARVPKKRIRERDAYEFFVRLDAHGDPVWSSSIADRGGVFTNPGAVYRTQVTYHAPSKRYLLNTIGRGNDTRFHGGFGIYDAPNPWGPWTTAFFTDNWDVGPGETNSFPTKWMSADGRTAWLVFSGDDHFSTRKATFHYAGDSAP
jgi:Beta-lactamase class C and other penicillin binding proteins